MNVEFLTIFVATKQIDHWNKLPTPQTESTENLFRESKSNFSGLNGNVVPQEINGSRPTSFALATVAAATNNFSDSNILGKGGFGHVYKVNSSAPRAPAMLTVGGL